MTIKKSVVFNGQLYKRPTKTDYRQWKQPTRECKTEWRTSFSQSLQPGIIVLSTHNKDDEGYTRKTIEIDFDAGLASITTDCSDCDGKTGSTMDFEYICGSWKEVNSSQYDKVAEAMGY